MKNTSPTYEVPVKERLQRFQLRLKTLFNVPEFHTDEVNGKNKRIKRPSNANIPVKIPNFWYTPFEVYLLAHLQRAYIIMTCDEYAYVDSRMKYLTRIYPKGKIHQNYFDDEFRYVGTIEMRTMPGGLLAVKKSNGDIEFLRENETNN